MEDDDNIFSAISGIFTTIGVITTAVVVINMYSEEKNEHIDVAVPKEEISKLEQGNGDVGQLYKKFSTEVDPFITKDKVEVLVISKGDTTKIEHFPKLSQ